MNSDDKRIAITADEAIIIATCIIYTSNAIKDNMSKMLSNGSGLDDSFRRSFPDYELLSKLDVADIKTDHLILAETSLVRYTELLEKIKAHIQNNIGESDR